MAGFRLANVRLFAMPEDWPAAWDFYANTLGLTVTSLALEAGIVVFQAGEISLCVERVDESERALVGRETGIGFRVENAQATCAFLESRNVEITGWPEKQGWGGILMHVKDPAGNVIDLAEYPK